MEPPKNGESEIYLYTWCPVGATIRPKFQYVSHINEFFRRWKNCMSDFEVNPELTVQGNIHYHGFFILKDKIKWFKSILPKMKRNGFIKINLVKKDFESAISYSRKDNEMMIKVMKGIPVPFVPGSLPSLIKLVKELKQKGENKTILDYIKPPSRKGAILKQTGRFGEDESSLEPLVFELDEI